MKAIPHPPEHLAATKAFEKWASCGCSYDITRHTDEGGFTTYKYNDTYHAWIVWHAAWAAAMTAARRPARKPR